MTGSRGRDRPRCEGRPRKTHKRRHAGVFGFAFAGHGLILSVVIARAAIISACFSAPDSRGWTPYRNVLVIVDRLPAGSGCLPTRSPA